ncbi:TonB-dependent receptor plug domain-containing protein [Aurantiacibacter gilvus]|uniref:TonB-dependent receptor n=1 Tax=Aurantiacibacter gilvus TaxID=3139141 RepID=A0ABU9IFG5_9SPHN
MITVARHRLAVELLLGCGTAMSLLMASQAVAQSAQSEEVEQADDESVTLTPRNRRETDIVVTGTLLPGVAPVGTEVIVIDRSEIAKSGAARTPDILADVPQITSSFMATPSGTRDREAYTYRPNIRDINVTGGSPTTLLLLNGRNIVGVGRNQSPDPSFIPPAVLDRVEVVPDGGSSLYGAQAVGGIINFITIRRFSGLEVSGRAGVAEDYYSVDGNLLAGHDWGSGSVLAAYSYTEHDGILGLDRDYVTEDFRSVGGPDDRSFACAVPNIRIDDGDDEIYYPLPDLVAVTNESDANRCDTTDYESIFPAERRHSALVGFNQELGEVLEFNVTGIWGRNDWEIQSAVFAPSTSVSRRDPVYRPIPSVDGNPRQRVFFSYEPILGPVRNSEAFTEVLQIVPELIWQVGDDWNVSLSGNYGESRTRFDFASYDAVQARGYYGDGLLNPYDIAASDPATLTEILDYGQTITSDQEVQEVRLDTDFELLNLPGGAVRVAAGGEHHYERFDVSSGSGPPGEPVPSGGGSRKVNSVFGEILVPVIGPENSFPLASSLLLSASARYDHYSDFGSTTNVKVGATWEPVEWVSIRGNYGTSFTAPTLADTVADVDNRASYSSSSRRTPDGETIRTRPTITLIGGAEGLQPQTAETYSVGIDVRPEFIPGLTLSGTYFNVNFDNLITTGQDLIGTPESFSNPDLAPYLILNPTQDQLEAAVAGLTLQDFPGSAASLYDGDPSSYPYLILDLRRKNLGTFNIDGLDFAARYTRPTRFGSINASLNGTYTLGRESIILPDSAPVDVMIDQRRLALTGTIGMTHGRYDARVRVSHSGGYEVSNALPQTHISSYTLVDFAFSYDLDPSSRGRRLLMLNVDNVFDQDPPVLFKGSGYGNGATLGRVISLGLRFRI